MKKKVLLLSLAIMLGLTGVVSAAASWGKYKGYDIVRITVGGKTVKAVETPAISFNGKTMIPIYMLKDAGIKYTWDSETSTVNIDKQSSSNDDVKKIKAYATLASHYNVLDEIGRSLSSIAQTFEVVYNHYSLGTDPGVDIDTAFSVYNTQVNRFNDRLLMPDLAADQGNILGVDTSDVSVIMSEYKKSLDLYKTSLMALEQLSYNGYSANQYNIYFNNASKALDITNENSLKAYMQYRKYISIATR